MAGLEAPEEAKGISMPPHERLGPHNRQKLPPFDDLSEQGECDSRDVVRAARPDLAFDVTGELLSEKQIFGRQLRLGPKHQPQQAQQVSEEGECRRNTCADNTVCNQSPSVSLVGGRATECFLRSTGLLAGDARRAIDSFHSNRANGNGDEGRPFAWRIAIGTRVIRRLARLPLVCCRCVGVSESADDRILARHRCRSAMISRCSDT
jgi:hypothetical protein